MVSEPQQQKASALIDRAAGCVNTDSGFKQKACVVNEMKWNESGFRPLLCTYRLNWARRTSWGWWDDRDDTVLQTQDSKFESWRSEAEHATSRSRRLPTILTSLCGKRELNNTLSRSTHYQGQHSNCLSYMADKEAHITPVRQNQWQHRKYSGSLHIFYV